MMCDMGTENIHEKKLRDKKSEAHLIIAGQKVFVKILFFLERAPIKIKIWDLCFVSASRKRTLCLGDKCCN